MPRGMSARATDATPRSVRLPPAPCAQTKTVRRPPGAGAVALSTSARVVRSPTEMVHSVVEGGFAIRVRGSSFEGRDGSSDGRMIHTPGSDGACHLCLTHRRDVAALVDGA